jgi:hypothetical protein
VVVAVGGVEVVVEEGTRIETEGEEIEMYLICMLAVLCIDYK